MREEEEEEEENVLSVFPVESCPWSALSALCALKSCAVSILLIGVKALKAVSNVVESRY